MLGSSESLLESDRTATDKLHKQATSSSFGSDEESSNDDQVSGVLRMHASYGSPLHYPWRFIKNLLPVIDCNYMS